MLLVELPTLTNLNLDQTRFMRNLFLKHMQEAILQYSDTVTV